MRHRSWALLILVSIVVTPLTAQSTGLLRGTVMLDAASPAPGALVGLHGTTTFRATADEEGRFLLAGIPAGRYVVMASLEGRNPGTATATIRGGDTVTVSVTVGGPVELAEITVTAVRSRAYAADSASTGSKIAVPLRDLPQTVTVVSEAVIRDRNVTDVSRLAENVSGVIPVVGYTGYGLNEQHYIIRGLNTSYSPNALRDGFRDFAGIVPRDVASIERVEFLKGPSSVLYGSTGALGGIPNTVTKKPTATRIAELTALGDGSGLARGTLDLGGLLRADSALRFRFIAAGERSRNFRPFDGGSYGISVVPSLELIAGPKTRIRVTGEYTRRRYRPDPYLPLDRVSFNLPADRFYGEPGFPLATAEGFLGQLVLEHRFTPTVRLRQGFSLIGGVQNHESVFISGFTAPDTVFRGASITRERSRDYSSQTELTIEGRRFGLRHRALVGLEVSRHVYAVDFTIDDLAPISLSDPVYGAPRVPGLAIDASHPENQLGVYAQDLIDVGSKVKVMLGARFDANRTTQYVFGDVAARQTTRHVSPRAGLVYQPSGTLSFYAGWARSFFPNLGCPSCGDPPTFPPEYGEQFEGGIRQELAQGRLSLNAAVYQLKKKNALEPVPGDTLGKSFLSAEQRSRGVELDIQGSPARGWNVVLSYAFTDARQTQTVDSAIPVGDRLGGVPRHAGSLWTTYAVSSGSLGGLEFGGGLYLSGSREATFPNDIQVPGWGRVDLMLRYVWDRWQLQLNLDNVTDKRYLEGNPSALARQAPRALTGSITARF